MRAWLQVEGGRVMFVPPADDDETISLVSMGGGVAHAEQWAERYGWKLIGHWRFRTRLDHSAYVEILISNQETGD